MQITLEIDDRTVEEIDAAAKDFNKSRLEYINDTLLMSLRRNKPKRNYTSEEVRQMYAEAYRKNPVQPDEFEIDEDQMIEVWGNL